MVVRSAWLPQFGQRTISVVDSILFKAPYYVRNYVREVRQRGVALLSLWVNFLDIEFVQLQYQIIKKH